LYEFKTKVLDGLIVKSANNDVELITIQIEISNSDWMILLKNITNSTKKYFKNKFSDYLSDKLRKFDVKCKLKSKTNHIKKDLSRKVSSPWFKGSFICVNKLCKNLYICTIKEKPKEGSIVMMEVKYCPVNFHSENVPIKIKSRGSDRYQQSVELGALGVSNCKDINIIENRSKSVLEKKLTKKESLAMIKSEFLHQNRISNDIFHDAQSAKIIHDNYYKKVFRDGLLGFIQEISLDPFGFLLISDIQVTYY
jgi:hypothetical protein